MGFDDSVERGLGAVHQQDIRRYPWTRIRFVLDVGLKLQLITRTVVESLVGLVLDRLQRLLRFRKAFHLIKLLIV